MSRRFRTNLAILLVALAIAAAIKAWADSLLTGSDSTGAIADLAYSSALIGWMQHPGVLRGRLRGISGATDESAY